MIIGYVTDLQALLPITVRLSSLQELTIEFIIDTGFTDFLILPSVIVNTMGLPFLYRIPTDLADSTTVEVDVYNATIIWNEAEREVRVLALGHRPLLGVALLEGYKLAVEFRENGQVTVDTL